jgi:hypothetical protein
MPSMRPPERVSSGGSVDAMQALMTMHVNPTMLNTA